MAVLNVPGTHPTIASAVAVAASGDTILVATGYGGNEAVDVTVNNLTFSAPSDVPNITLSAGAGVLRITLADASPIRIIGNTANNIFVGNAGANQISDGNGGDDTIDGGGGDDLITSSGGTDTLRGGSGNDRIQLDNAVAGTVDGGSGTDTVQTVDLGSYAFSNVETLDTYYGFLVGSVAQIASFGNITAVLGTPETQIALSLRGIGGTLDFTTRIGGDLSVSTLNAGLTSAIDITGSGNDDFLVGSAFGDTLRGGSGADTLVGGDGNDTLVGDAGADILSGGAGRDVLTGNGDGDTATYFNATGVSVSLATTSAQHTKSAGIDTLSGISNLIGSDYVDELTGDGNANQLDGGLGNDTAFGGGGDDALIGGGGNDRLLGGAGADALDGGAGRDRAQYSDAASGLRADLQNASVNTGAAAGDTYISIENLVGSDFNDNLRGDTGDNGIWGKAGDDLIFGRAGDDRLEGGTGNDTLSGGAGQDTFVFQTALNPTTNVDLITDFNVADDTIAIDTAVFTTITGTGTLSLGQFIANAAGTAQDADDHIVYDTDSGQLFFDSNGNAAGGSVQFAELGVGLALTASNFLIVA